MFYRRWDGLPKDPVFETDLKKLGYFINEDDEVRSIEDSQYYFKYRLDKNERINERQRFHFNLAIQDVIHERLIKEGLTKMRLPFDKEANEQHVPIFLSNDLKKASRVVIIFGEPCQQLGHLALRVANNQGGINKGSMVSVVQALKKQRCSALDPNPPGIILANTGELFWWEEGKRPITIQQRSSMPMPSAVQFGRSIQNSDFLNGQDSIQNHIAYVFDKVLPAMGRKKCAVDLIGVGNGGDELLMYLDNGGYRSHKDRINTLTLLGSIIDARNNLGDQPFKRFLATRARTWINSREPLGTPMADHNGNPNAKIVFVNQGTAGVYSSGVSWHLELIFLNALDQILDWIQAVAMIGAKNYKHPKVVVTYSDPVVAECDWSEQAQANDKSKGLVHELANGHATGVGGDGAQDDQDLSKTEDKVTADKASERVSKSEEHINTKCGLNFYAEDGEETPSQHSDDNQPAPRPNSDGKPNINFFADVSDGEEDDMDPETKARVNQGLLRFFEMGSMMDPREEEMIEAEIRDMNDGIAGMY